MKQICRKKERKERKKIKRKEEKIMFGSVLWHINLCWLFNAKSILIHINYSIIYKYLYNSVLHIWPIDRTLSSATTPERTGPGSNGNKGVLCIPQSSSIARASPSVSYTGQSLGESYRSAEKQSCILQPQPTRPGRKKGGI